MKVLVIGFGSMGQRHAANAAALGHEVCVYDATTARLAEAGLHHATLPALQPHRFGLDAVVVATPAATHAEVAQALLREGYGGPLFVEKPLVTSLAEAAVFCAWPSDVLMVGYNWRFHAGVQAMKRQMTEWTLRVREAAFWVDCDSTTWPGSDYADGLLEMSHEIDTALYVLGAARCIEAALDGTAWTLTLQHAAGATSQITLDDHAAAIGRGGRITTSGIQGADYATATASPEALVQSYRAEMVHFLLDVQAGYMRGSACTLWDALQVLRIIAQESAPILPALRREPGGDRGAAVLSGLRAPAILGRASRGPDQGLAVARADVLRPGAAGGDEGAVGERVMQKVTKPVTKPRPQPTAPKRPPVTK